MTKRTKTILIGGLGLLVLLFLLTVPFRGWTRGSLAPAYARLIYGNRTASTFDREFAPIQDELTNYGFKLIGRHTVKQGRPVIPNTISGCMVDGYEGLGETIHCYKITEFKPASFTEAFKNQWIEQSPALAQFLESNGWQKQYADQSAFDAIFSHSKDRGATVGYRKSKDGIECWIGVAYNPPYPNPDDQFWLAEKCSRDVKFFGGY